MINATSFVWLRGSFGWSSAYWLFDLKIGCCLVSGTTVRKSTLKIDRYCPLVMQGFSDFKGFFQVIMADPGLSKLGKCFLLDLYGVFWINFSNPQRPQKWITQRTQDIHWRQIDIESSPSSKTLKVIIIQRLRRIPTACKCFVTKWAVNKNWSFGLYRGLCTTYHIYYPCSFETHLWMISKPC